MLSKSTLLIGCLLTFLSASSKTFFVDAQNYHHTEDGSTWFTAYSNLQSALDAASAGDEIWLKNDVYYPDNKTFVWKGDVSVIGGFQGNETNRHQRDASKGATFLSGASLSKDQENFSLIEGDLGGGRLILNRVHFVQVESGQVAVDHLLDLTSVGDVVIEECHFTGFRLKASLFSFQHPSGRVLIRQCTFEDNMCESNLIFLESEARFESCMFKHNKYADIMLSSLAKMSLRDCSITEDLTASSIVE